MIDNISIRYQSVLWIEESDEMRVINMYFEMLPGFDSHKERTKLIRLLRSQLIFKMCTATIPKYAN